MAKGHPFHRYVGMKLMKLRTPPGSAPILDSACAGPEQHNNTHNLPLFATIRDDGTGYYKAVEFTDVDAFFPMNNKVRVIVEIEESGIRANKLCSKFMSAALSDYYRRGEETIHLDDVVLFVQVLKSKNKIRNDGSSATWSYLGGKFNGLKLAEGRTMRYAIYWGDENGLVGTTSLSLEDRIMHFLKKEDL
jgi:hypothetical protein